MATTLLPPDFRDFLQLLNSETVEYLLIGGFAVGYHGYPRATGDLDIFINPSLENAEKVTRVLLRFGFSAAAVSPELFVKPHQVLRMGVPPLRIELLTTISGVDFATCYLRRVTDIIDGIEVSLISLQDLKTNKKASARAKDLNDLEHLP